MLGLSCAASAQNAATIPRIEIGLDASRNPKEVATSLQLLALFTVLSLAPSILIMTTAFTRIVIVLSFLRSAIGAQGIPPNQVLIGLSLFLTFHVMSPVIDIINTNALQPYMKNQIGYSEALKRAQAPIRDFMLRQTYERDLGLFVKLRGEDAPQTPDDLPMMTIIPAFITSELKTAFIIGFYIYIPFVVIDLVVASTLMSMGMMMLPPIVVSLPAKVLVFLLANGWSALIEALAEGFR